jgi:hypothetical protein
MGLPSQSITLTVEQVTALNQKLATLRHDVNNNLSLIMAAVELVTFKPELAPKMMATVTAQPPKITDSLNRFSSDLEAALGITRQ